MSSPWWPPKREGPPPNAGKEWPSKVLSPYEVDLLLGATGRSRSHELRDRALLALMYRADLKVGQLSELPRTAYKQHSRQLTLQRGKRTETKVLDAETATALNDWIAERRRIGIDTPPMFCALLRETRGGTLTTVNIRNILKARKKRAGLDRRVNPEAIRKSGREYLGAPGSFSAFELHPAIAHAAAQLITDGHYDSAVQKGTIAFRDVLREESGLHKRDGVDLVGAALGGDDPPIVLADLTTKEGKAEQAGWAALARLLRRPPKRRRSP